MFQRTEVRALPVVNHKRQLVGMVTYKELAASQNRYVNKVKILLEGDVGMIPVVEGEDEVVVGMITR